MKIFICVIFLFLPMISWSGEGTGHGKVFARSICVKGLYREIPKGSQKNYFLTSLVPQIPVKCSESQHYQRDLRWKNLSK